NINGCELMNNKKQDNWYKLDNAAKIYPAIIGKKDSGVFRVSANLNNFIIPDILGQALIDLKHRFPSMYVKLKKGLFWYYFEKNERIPIVKKETPYINELIDVSKNNNYLFTLFYYNNRISLECFHSLCDGYGAIEFLKAIVFRYLELLGNKINSEDKVLTINQKVMEEEIEDSFKKNFTSKVIKHNKVDKAYHIRDIHFPHYYNTGIISGKINTNKLLFLARKSNATITEYLAALLTYSVYESYRNDNFKKKVKPINISIPVNMRRFFNSKTLRNFSLFFYTSVDINKRNLKFNDILNKVKKNFKKEIDKDKLQSNLNSNVGAEKNFFMKITPLFLKNILLRIASNILGNSLSTMTLSNLGNIDIPKSMKNYIKDMKIILGSNYSQTNNVGVISCNEITTISFSRTIFDTCIEQTFFRFLAKEGLSVEIESNMIENYL
ncbi:MAG: hypothetical protein WDA21_04000, partial [Bacilli bacterium]